MWYKGYMARNIPIRRIKSKIISLLKKERDIAAVYLFGSLTEGFFHDNSDIDLAILFNKEVNFNKELSLGVDLESALRRKLDLINLNNASMNLAFRVISKGILIYENDYTYHSDFLESLFRNFHDFRPKYDNFMKEFEASL